MRELLIKILQKSGVPPEGWLRSMEKGVGRMWHEALGELRKLVSEVKRAGGGKYPFKERVWNEVAKKIFEKYFQIYCKSLLYPRRLLAWWGRAKMLDWTSVMNLPCPVLHIPLVSYPFISLYITSNISPLSCDSEMELYCLVRPPAPLQQWREMFPSPAKSSAFVWVLDWVPGVCLFLTKKGMHYRMLAVAGAGGKVVEMDIGFEGLRALPDPRGVEGNGLGVRLLWFAEETGTLWLKEVVERKVAIRGKLGQPSRVAQQVALFLSDMELFDSYFLFATPKPLLRKFILVK